MKGDEVSTAGLPYGSAWAKEKHPFKIDTVRRIVVDKNFADCYESLRRIFGLQSHKDVEFTVFVSSDKISKEKGAELVKQNVSEKSSRSGEGMMNVTEK